MTIMVVTVYEGIGHDEVKDWADRVFATPLGTNWTPEQLAEMKKDFLAGKDVLGKSSSPDGTQHATTRWRLLR